MVESMMVTMKTIKSMVTVNLHGLIAVFIKVNGSKEDNMDWEPLLMKVDK